MNPQYNPPPGPTPPPGQPYPGQPPYAAPPFPGQQFPGPPQPQRRVSYGRCVLASLVWFAAVFVAMFAFLGPPASASAVGLLTSRLLLPLLLSALVTWLIFRRKPTGFGILVLTSLPFFALFMIFTGVLRMAGRS